MRNRTSYLILVSLVVACSQGANDDAATHSDASAEASAPDAGIDAKLESSAPDAPHEVDAAVTAPLHVPSWAYGATKYAFDPGPALTQKYLDYVEAMSSAKASVNCPPTQMACTPVVYVNAGTVYTPTDPTCPYDYKTIWEGASENWFQHDATPISAANRIQAIQKGKSCNGTDSILFYPFTANPSLQTAYKDYLDKTMPPNAVFMEDNFPTTVAGALSAYGGGHTSSIEYPTDAAMHLGQASFIDALGTGTTPHRGFTNSLAGGGWMSNSIVKDISVADLTTHGNFLGFVAEKPMYSSGATPLVTAQNAIVMLNTAANINQRPGIHFVLLDVIDTQPERQVSALIGRRLHTALSWLVFDLDHTINWEQSGPADATTVGFFPEQLIVPTQPLRTMSAFSHGGTSDGSGCGAGAELDQGGAKDLLAPAATACGKTFSAQKPAGVYVREFGQCFVAGAPLGTCAAVLNSTNADVALDASFFTQTCGHRVKMIGRVHAELGCATCDGSLDLTSDSFALGSSVPANDALLLVP